MADTAFQIGTGESAAPPAERSYMARLLRTAIVPGTSVIVFFSAWEIIVRLGEISSYILPAPSDVLMALWYHLRTLSYWEAIGITTFETVFGFLIGAIAGVSIGTALALSSLMDRIFYPYVVALQTIPKVAIAPLMIVWFGFGLESKLIIVALTAMFPVLINTIAGLRSTEADRLDLLKGLCASRWQSLRYVQFPSALPYIFAGLNTAIVFAVIGAIVGEFVGARKGLGVHIIQSNFNLDLASVFSSLVVLGVMGVILNSLMMFAERRICFWSGNRR
jgi:NitT/TauT family transport system permease protein